MKKLIVFLMIFISASFAQELSKPKLDSIYNRFIDFKDGKINEPEKLSTEGYDKCGLELFNSVRENLAYFDSAQQRVLKNLLQRPQLETSIISPGGFFRIHYNTSGIAAPQYDIIELAAALDSVYNFEITFLKYPLPPPDNGIGDDNKYDIYIEDLSPQRIYGYTDPESVNGNGKVVTYIGIDNDFGGFFRQGIDAAKVTIAHEFHHAIQLGGYINKYSSDAYFYELTSTAMEEFVYDDVNDYYQYLNNYFQSPSKALVQYVGYDIAIWHIFLQRNFGYDIIKRQWELFLQTRALEAMSQSLLEAGSDFGKELNEFGVWAYFTNFRQIPGEYFEEGANYPPIKFTTPIEFDASVKTIQVNARATSNNYLKFYNSNNNDTLVAIVTNSDVGSGIDSLAKYFLFEYSLYNYNAEGSNKLTEDYYSKLDVAKPVFWLASEVLNDFLIREGVTTAGDISFIFPNPFKYKKNSFVYIPVADKNAVFADLNIYSSGMDLVFSSSQSIIKHPAAGNVVRWNAMNENGSKLPSGVYIYAVKCGDKTNIGKLVIFNE